MMRPNLFLDRNFFSKPGILKETFNKQLSILYGAGMRTQAGESTQAVIRQSDVSKPEEAKSVKTT